MSRASQPLHEAVRFEHLEADRPVALQAAALLDLRKVEQLAADVRVDRLRVQVLRGYGADAKRDQAYGYSTKGAWPLRLWRDVLSLAHLHGAIVAELKEKSLGHVCADL